MLLNLSKMHSDNDDVFSDALLSPTGQWKHFAVHYTNKTLDISVQVMSSECISCASFYSVYIILTWQTN